MSSLYIHIPFCIKKCNYCDFFSSAESEYVDLVINKIKCEIKSLYDDFAPNFKTVYIGGGTPSSIDMKYIQDILSVVDLSNASEVTIEVNPESITKEKLDFYYELGINRLSMGVQSFYDELLITIGRNCNAKTSIAACELVSKHWKGRFSLDLINCIEGQTPIMAKNDVEQLVSYNPTHVSIYNLTLDHESLDMPEVEKASIDALLLAGYDHYEVSNFSRNGDVSEHNLSYWKMDDFYGVGPSASGTFLYKGVHFRRENFADIKKYLDSNNCYKETVISEKDFAFEYLMMRLRLRNGITYKEYLEKSDEPFPMEVVEKWDNLGLLISNNDGFRFTDSGYNKLNQFLIDILD